MKLTGAENTIVTEYLLGVVRLKPTEKKVLECWNNQSKNFNPSQQDLANRLGIARSHVNAALNSLENVRKILIRTGYQPVEGKKSIIKYGYKPKFLEEARDWYTCKYGDKLIKKHLENQERRNKSANSNKNNNPSSIDPRETWQIEKDKERDTQRERDRKQKELESLENEIQETRIHQIMEENNLSRAEACNQYGLALKEITNRCDKIAKMTGQQFSSLHRYIEDKFKRNLEFDLDLEILNAPIDLNVDSRHRSNKGTVGDLIDKIKHDEKYEKTQEKAHDPNVDVLEEEGLMSPPPKRRATYDTTFSKSLGLDPQIIDR